MAARQLGGGLSRQITPIKNQLIHLIAGLEAGIDFVEDDLELISVPAIQRTIEEIRGPLAALEQSARNGRLVREGYKVAIVGRPNAGKSSLFNALLETDRAIVTAAPGTTRDLVTDYFSLDGIPVELTDTAGIRSYTTAALGGDFTELLDEAERLGIKKSRQAMAEAHLVLLVHDVTSDWHPDDLAILTAQRDTPLLLALSKCDLIPTRTKSDLEKLSSNIHTAAEGDEAVSASPPSGEKASVFMASTSTLTGAGILELREAIAAAMAHELPSADTAALTNLRQLKAIRETVAALDCAHEAIGCSLPHEVVLLDLQAALTALGDLTGATPTEEILPKIFSTFCIGK